MKEMREIRIPGGSLRYEVSREEIHVMEGRSQDTALEIPEQIEGLPVAAVEKKAFLGSKRLREVFLPDTVKEIGDWAFAHCGELWKVMLPRREILFGRGVFKDCKALAYMGFNGEEPGGTEELLAAAPVRLSADYLLSLPEVGAESWYEKLDARLKALLLVPDEEGYLKQVLCGEEDLMASLDLYLAERRREKARLCYVRLLNDRKLEKDMRRFLEEYLRGHSKGCDCEAAWEVALREKGNELRYCQCFAGAGCITEKNFDALLRDIGEEYAEMKAYLLRYKEENLSSREDDFFTALSLD